MRQIALPILIAFALAAVLVLTASASGPGTYTFGGPPYPPHETVEVVFTTNPPVIHAFSHDFTPTGYSGEWEYADQGPPSVWWTLKFSGEDPHLQMNVQINAADQPHVGYTLHQQPNP